MNKLLLIVFLVSANFASSQDKACNCSDELENVSHLITNAKSYKVFVNNATKKTEFENWKSKIKNEIASDSLSSFFCSGYLQKYISFIPDRHNTIYNIPDSISTAIPTYSKVVDTTKITSEIDGIYYAGTHKIYLKREADSIWFGIMMTYKSPNWPAGKIRMRIKKLPNGKFEIFEYFPNGILSYQNNIEINGGRIHSTFWNKQNKYFFNKNHESNFTYKEVNANYDYIGIKTLSRTTTLMKEAAEFYKNTLPKLTKSNLIIDFRNNGGGAELQAKELLKSIKKNKSIKNIFVVTNFQTGSAAEIITLELKKDKRTITVGENSKGMLQFGYGNNSFSAETDCFNYNVSFSTEQNSSKFSNYEYVGIKPDFALNNTSDWIEQINNLLAR